MTPSSSPLSRRAALKATLAGVGLTAAAFEPVHAVPAPDVRRGSPKRYDMLKSINLWAFPYPERMSLRECLQLAKDAGFDGRTLWKTSPAITTTSGCRAMTLSTAVRKTAATSASRWLMPAAVCRWNWR